MAINITPWTRPTRDESVLDVPPLTLADRIAAIGGSWGYVFGFAIFVVGWITVQYFWAFDPYPFVFLNLLIGCLAALQAPIILMSANNQEKVERAAMEKDIKLDAVSLQKLNEILAKLQDQDR